VAAFVVAIRRTNLNDSFQRIRIAPVTGREDRAANFAPRQDCGDRPIDRHFLAGFAGFECQRHPLVRAACRLVSSARAELAPVIIVIVTQLLDQPLSFSKSAVIALY